MSLLVVYLTRDLTPTEYPLLILYDFSVDTDIGLLYTVNNNKLKSVGKIDSNSINDEVSEWEKMIVFRKSDYI